MPAIQRTWFEKKETAVINQGFLEEEAIQDDGLSYADVADKRLLVLVGAPGVGKTTAFRSAFDEECSRGIAASLISMARIQAYESLLDAVQEGDEPHEVVFLDGLDECPSNILAAQDWVLRLSKAKPEVRLRMSMRTADWSQGFGLTLKREFGESAVLVLELRHFRLSEVAAFAESAGVDQQAFLERVKGANCEALASLPVTLQMLVRMFRETGDISRDRNSVYRAGLMALLEESNPDRRAIGAAGVLDAPARLELAARIASSSVLANRATIWDGLYSDKPPEDSMVLADVAGGEESIGISRIAATMPHLREVVRSGLFLPIHNELFGWSHKTFAEYLAAYYMVRRAVPLKVKLELLFSGPGDAGGVPPQLREAAAWLSSMDQEFRDHLLEQQPELLLSSDVTMSFPEDRKSLVRGYLAKLDAGHIFDNYNWRDKYQFLKHPELSTQLLPYLSATDKNVLVRRAAIDIAEACQATETAPAILQVALNLNENPIVRSRATWAYPRLASSPEGLLPLLSEDAAGEDPDDEVKGYALAALWPQHLPPSRLFRLITPPKKDHFIGAYSLFLHTLDLSGLTEEGIVAAIQWARSVSTRNKVDFRTADVFEKILQAAWVGIENDAVLEQFALLVLDSTRIDSRLRHEVDTKDFQRVLLKSPAVQRQKLIHRVLANAPSEWQQGRLLLFLPWQMVSVEDLPWLVEDLVSGKFAGRETTVLELIIGVIDWSRAELLDWVWDQRFRSAPLDEAIAQISFVDLESDFARWEIENSRRRAKAKALPEERAIAPGILDLLADAESDPTKWWRFDSGLLRTEEGASGEFTGSILHTAFWKTANDELKERVIRVAHNYLVQYRLRSEKWKAPNQIFRPAVAGYRALRVLLTERVELYRALEGGVWGHWARSIIALSTNDGDAEESYRRLIAKDAYRADSASFISAVREYLEADAPNRLHHVAKLVDGWDEESIQLIVWGAAQRKQVDPVQWGRVASILCRGGFAPAVAAAQDVTRAGQEGQEVDAYAAQLVAAGFAANPGKHVAGLMSLCSTNADAGKEVWKGIATTHGRGQDNPVFVLSEDLLGEIYVWICRKFPQREPDGGWVSPADEVADLGDAIFRFLVAKGTGESLTSLGRIVDELPERPWLKWSLLEARENVRRKSWRPPSPRRVLEILLLHVLPRTTGSSKELIEFEAQERESRRLPPKQDEELAPTPERSQERRVTPGATLTILVAVTEWHSHHGGLPTLNRKLCAALSRAGHHVLCLVPEPTAEEIADAKSSGVTLVRPESSPGLSPKQRLLLGPQGAVSPDIVIGHGHITGPEALYLARSKYKAKYGHVAHTLPEEIEQFKTDADGSFRTGRYVQADVKRQHQLELCKGADLVIAVGPRIYRALATDMSAYPMVKVVQLIPGLDDALAQHYPAVERMPLSRCLFSCRQEDPVLKGTDIVIGVALALECDAAVQGISVEMRGFDVRAMDDQVESLKSNFGHCSCINYFPYRSDSTVLYDDLKRASLVLMPSRKEGYGLAALEAMAAGVPVLISSESGVGLMLVEMAQVAGGRIGAIAKKSVIPVKDRFDEDSKVWAGEVRRVLSNRATAFSDAADIRKWLAQELQWDKAGQELSDEIAQVVSGPVDS